MTNCPACQSLAASVQNAQAEGNAEKERIMRKLLDQHQSQHRVNGPVVIWKDGTKWTMIHT